MSVNYLGACICLFGRDAEPIILPALRIKPRKAGEFES
jgi:hypothetical protein